ncbi:ATP-binding cassette domain-containing protein [Paenibacillus ginsengarvi]|uniref:ABC transporter ATP-binding protein n=1 Tax=Paenibacillus ginsengarvi TaxID=400777 RepID=A0A3B0CLA9_9BACL|nr:ABC transporter ATP-binding protein [Paenibacillus ginsengarvi]RKN84776.1 ABC transporter ATP-binding protein [Paenibacillus ginsengarvi]
MRDVWVVLKAMFLYAPIRYGTVAFLRIVGYGGLGVLTGLLIKRFFDEASASRLTASSVIGLAALLLIVPLVQAFSYYLDLSLSYGWTEIIRAIFRRNLFRFALEHPGASPLPVSHGKLMNIIRTDAAVPESLMWDLPYFLAYTLFSLCGLAVLGAIDAVTTASLFVPMLLAVIASQMLKRRIGYHYERQQKTSDRFLGLLSDILRHHETIRINSASPAFLNRLAAAAEERATAGKRNTLFQALLGSVYEYIVGAGIVLLLLLISGNMRTGGVTVGSFTLFIFFLGYVSNAIRMMSTVTAGFKKAESALSRIAELFGEESVRKLTRHDSLYLDAAPPLTPAPTRSGRLERMELRRLGYRYPGTDRGIDDIGFSLPRASITVITGPVGAGKTTLLRTVLGLLEGRTGDVVWHGSALPDPGYAPVPPLAGYVPQIPSLYSGTLRDNLLLGYPDDSLEEALHVSMLEDEMTLFPDGLDTRVGPNGATLSGGQRQRLAIARMIVRKAELWVLDDISSALDADTEIRLWQRIDKVRRREGITCLVVSNKPYVTAYADQMLTLEDGKIVSSKSRSADRPASRA